MPSQNMLPKGHRRRSVRPQYVATRGVEPAEPEPAPVLALKQDTPDEHGMRRFQADPAAAGMRLDLYLAQTLPDVSRARVQMLIEAGQVSVRGAVGKTKQRLQGGEQIEIAGEARPEPLQATAEDIPLDILFEDRYLAVVNKPAGMTVHAGAGASDEERNRGTLVNALLFHLSKLSGVGGNLRPGIVHRLDKLTSGVIVIAKEDVTHRKLGEMFAAREVAKTYLALAHGHLERDLTMVNLPIARDLARRTRMTTRRPDGRSALSHMQVLKRLTTAYGKFTLLEVRIETGRTHQIRVHLQALKHPVVGDTLYGAPRVVRRLDRPEHETLELDRNFLHAARLAFTHPRTGAEMVFEAPLPVELTTFQAALEAA